MLRKRGVVKGDRVAIYLPVGLQGVAAMLACARIGAIHSVIFTGFSAQALAHRIDDAQCKILLAQGKILINCTAYMIYGISLISIISRLYHEGRTKSGPFINCF